MERNVDLERSILEAPEDLAGYAVYGDWLTERGDPLGELVAVQVALADPAHADDAGLLWQEQGLVTRANRARFGDHHPSQFDARWTLGFLGKLTVPFVTQMRDGKDIDLHALALDAIRSPEGRFLRALDLGFTLGNGLDATCAPVLAAFAAAGPHPSMRSLALGGGSQRMLGDFRRLWTLFPRLRSLTLRAAASVLPPPGAPELEELVLERARWLGLRELGPLLAGSFPRLRSLVIDDPRSDLAYALDVLRDGRSAPRLRRLSITRSSNCAELATTLSRSKLLGQLTVLDLSSGNLDNADAIALARGGQLGKLARLVVTDNVLTREGLATLREACPHVVSDIQRNDDYLDDVDLYP